MAVDSTRLAQMLAEHMQPGTGAKLRDAIANSPGGVFGETTELIRIQGKPSDVNYWRIYLGRWTGDAGDGHGGGTGTGVNHGPYAQPFPWIALDAGTPGASLGVSVLDDFQDLAVYAKIKWGGGGVNHTAWVDWPRRGQLIQVSGCAVYVTAVCCGVNNPLVVSPGLVIPFLEASIGIEPGGGDSDACATFTYPRQVNQHAGPPPQWTFQIPPFARTFSVIARRSLLKAAGAGPIIIQTGLFESGQPIEAEWEDDLTSNEDLALATYPIGRRAEDVFLTLNAPSGDPDTDSLGLIFNLDL
jgi:hypothetical protein